MPWEEYQEFQARLDRESRTAPAVLYFDDGQDPLVGTLERQRQHLLFKSENRTVTIFRSFLTALDPGDKPGELRFTIDRSPLAAIVFTPVREIGWIYWAAGR
ncbi:hypothetical protein ACPCA8_32175 [Streptomyces capoamus]|uniref:hypothetical protein n=1 Tax=Streptomyces capoamus TaxID=68183 RepID=UPI003C2F17F1